MDFGIVGKCRRFRSGRGKPGRGYTVVQAVTIKELAAFAPKEAHGGEEAPGGDILNIPGLMRQSEFLKKAATFVLPGCFRPYQFAKTFEISASTSGKIAVQLPAERTEKNPTSSSAVPTGWAPCAS